MILYARCLINKDQCLMSVNNVISFICFVIFTQRKKKNEIQENNRLRFTVKNTLRLAW